MFKTQPILLPIAFVLFISCAGKPDREISKSEFQEISPIHEGKPLSISGEINRSSDILFVKDKLIISDREDDFYFKVFNINKMTFDGPLGKIGEGPCEIGFPTFLQPIPSDDKAIGLVMKSSFGFQEMSLEITKNSEEQDCKNRVDKIPFDFMNYVKVSDSMFIGTGIFQKKYALYQSGQEGYEELDIEYPYLPAEITHVPNSIPMSQQGKFRIKPDGKAVLFTHGSNPFFDILEVDKGKITLKFRWEGEAPDFNGSDSPSGMSAIMTDENIYGFISSSTTENYIYLLYSGKTRNQGNEKYSNQIWVYDWSGKPIKKIKLDQEVNQIAVSPDDKYLISYHDNGKPNLIRYELN